MVVVVHREEQARACIPRGFSHRDDEAVRRGYRSRPCRAARRRHGRSLARGRARRDATRRMNPSDCAPPACRSRPATWRRTIFLCFKPRVCFEREKQVRVVCVSSHRARTLIPTMIQRRSPDSERFFPTPSSLPRDARCCRFPTPLSLLSFPTPSNHTTNVDSSPSARPCCLPVQRCDPILELPRRCTLLPHNLGAQRRNDQRSEENVTRHHHPKTERRSGNEQRGEDLGTLLGIGINHII